MIGIAILDDIRSEAEKICLLAKSFAATIAYPVTIQIFENSFELFDCIEKQGGFDIYLLDIIMPYITGIQVAEQLRKRGERCEIVFLTTSFEYGVDAFGVHAAGYLVKPVAERDLSEVLSRALVQMKRFDRPPVFIKIKGGIRKVLAEEIVMIESFNHHSELTLSDGQSLKTPTTLGQLEDVLKTYKEFCFPHRSYIVNLDYVKGIQNSCFLLPDRVVPIAKSLYRKVKEYYLHHCFEQ